MGYVNFLEGRDKVNLEPFDDQSFGFGKGFVLRGWLTFKTFKLGFQERNPIILAFWEMPLEREGLVLKHPLSCHGTSVFPSLWPEFTGKFSGKHPFQLDSPFFFHILDLTFSRTPEHLGS